MSIARHHAEWQSLLEISGPFLSLPVLMRVFPQGLDEDDPDQRCELRLAYEEWMDNQFGLQPEPAIHREWVHYVLGTMQCAPVCARPMSGDWPNALSSTTTLRN